MDLVDHLDVNKNTTTTTNTTTSIKQYISKLELDTFDDISDSNMGDFKQTAPEDNHSPTLILNVGGMKHETRVTTLQRMPTTRLADPNELALHFRPESRDHFFDRHPTVFAAILNFYRTGVLHVPQDVCGSTARMELQYWGIDERQMEDCCWLNYR